MRKAFLLIVMLACLLSALIADIYTSPNGFVFEHLYNDSYYTAFKPIDSSIVPNVLEIDYSCYDDSLLFQYNETAGVTSSFDGLIRFKFLNVPDTLLCMTVSIDSVTVIDSVMYQYSSGKLEMQELDMSHGSHVLEFTAMVSDSIFVAGGVVNYEVYDVGEIRINRNQDVLSTINLSETNVRKPLLFVEGFDPNNEIGVEGFEAYITSISSYIGTNNFNEYDVYLLSFGNNTDNMRNNAEVVLATLRELGLVESSYNCEHGFNVIEPVTVVGISMGSVITRYALAYAEENNVKHCCKQYISFDGPNRGATFNHKFQKTLQDTKDDVQHNSFNQAHLGEFRTAIARFKNTAAKQLLRKNYWAVGRNSYYSIGTDTYRDFFSELNEIDAVHNGSPTHVLNYDNGLNPRPGFPYKQNQIKCVGYSNGGLSFSGNTQLANPFAYFHISLWGWFQNVNNYADSVAYDRQPGSIFPSTCSTSRLDIYYNPVFVPTRSSLFLGPENQSDLTYNSLFEIGNLSVITTATNDLHEYTYFDELIYPQDGYTHSTIDETLVSSLYQYMVDDDNNTMCTVNGTVYDTNPQSVTIDVDCLVDEQPSVNLFTGIVPATNGTYSFPYRLVHGSDLRIRFNKSGCTSRYRYITVTETDGVFSVDAVEPISFYNINGALTQDGVSVRLYSFEGHTLGEAIGPAMVYNAGSFQYPYLIGNDSEVAFLFTKAGYFTVQLILDVSYNQDYSGLEYTFGSPITLNIASIENIIVSYDDPRADFRSLDSAFGYISSAISSSLNLISTSNIYLIGENFWVDDWDMYYNRQNPAMPEFFTINIMSHDINNRATIKACGMGNIVNFRRFNLNFTDVDFRGYDGSNSFIMKGKTVSTEELLSSVTLTRCHFTSIYPFYLFGMTLEDFANATIQYCESENCTVFSNNLALVKFRDVVDAEISHSSFIGNSEMGSVEGILSFEDCDNVYLHDSEFDATSSPFPNHYKPLVLIDDATDILIEKNTFTGSNCTYTTQPSSNYTEMVKINNSNSSTDYSIVKNIFVDNDNSLVCTDLIKVSSITPLKLTNNTFVGSQLGSNQFTMNVISTNSSTDFDNCIFDKITTANFVSTAATPDISVTNSILEGVYSGNVTNTANVLTSTHPMLSASYTPLWTSTYKSPCINSGNPDMDGDNILWNEEEVLDANGSLLTSFEDRDPDMSRPDIGAKAYDNHVENEVITLDDGINWVSFPGVDCLTTATYSFNNTNYSHIQVPYVFGEQSTLGDDLFDLSPMVLDYIYWEYDDGGYIKYYQNAWQSLTHEVKSTKGYKIVFTESATTPLDIEFDGFEAGTTNNSTENIQLFAPGQNETSRTTLAGYYLRESKTIFDAIPMSILDQLRSIKTRHWFATNLSYQNSQTKSTWSIGCETEYGSPTLNYGDAVELVFCGSTNTSFAWIDGTGGTTPDIVQMPIYFTYEEQLGYYPIVVEMDMDEYEEGDKPIEIAVFVEDECKGSAIIKDDMVHLKAYVVNDPDLIGEDLSFQLYFPAKNCKGKVKEYAVLDENERRYITKKLRVNPDDDFAYISLKHEDIDSGALPVFTTLKSNYPNPFNPETTISYDIAEETDVTLDVYNIRGQKVKTLVNERMKPGYNSVIWNGKDDNNRNVASGVYFYRLKTSDKTLTKKMMLLK